MHSGWNCAAPSYVSEWLPQFAPYDADLAREVSVREGNHVLSTAGAEAIAFARAVGESGSVDCLETSPEMRALCTERIASAAFEKRARVVERPQKKYDVIALAHVRTDGDPRAHLSDMLQTLRASLASNGKVGLLHWGPDSETDPERIFARAIEAVAPEALATSSRLDVDRASLTALFEAAGLALVRHTVVSHAIVFPTAARFARSLVLSRAYGARLTALGESRVAAVLARFYEKVSGEDATITFAPSATIAVAGLPGAELELPHRPSVRIPAVAR